MYPFTICGGWRLMQNSNSGSFVMDESIEASTASDSDSTSSPASCIFSFCEHVCVPWYLGQLSAAYSKSQL